MTHDKLCNAYDESRAICNCSFIARVREDERETAHRIYGYRNGYAAALDAARDAILRLHKPWARAYMDTEVLDALDALRGES